MSFTESAWSGKMNLNCDQCRFDTFSLDIMMEHQEKFHPITNWPKVSCIMPTYNRRAFIPFAIQQFMRYDYPNKELIIVDDGEQQIVDLIPLNCPLIRYIYFDEKKTLGWKRNKACELASGDIIAHHDDDDWYHSGRLMEMVKILLYGGKKLTGIRDAFFYLKTEAQAYQYRYGTNTRTRACGATLVYKKSLWEQNKFLDHKHVGEDSTFNRTAPQEACYTLQGSSLFVSIVHGENVSCGSRKDIDGVDLPIRNYQNKESWTPVPAQKVLDSLGDDAWIYQLSKKPNPICKVLITTVAGEMYESATWLGKAMEEVHDLYQCGIEAEIALVVDGSKETASLVAEAITHCPVKIHLLVNKEARGLYFCKNQLLDLANSLKMDYQIWWAEEVQPKEYLILQMILKMRSGGGNLAVLVPMEGVGQTGLAMVKPGWVDFALWSTVIRSEGVFYDELYSVEGLDGAVEEWDLLFQLTVKGFVLQYYEGMQLLKGKLRDVDTFPADEQQLLRKRDYLQSKWSRLSAAG